MSDDPETSPTSSKSQLRSGQREIKSCGFCYRSKVKCDRVFPCTRCVSRGLAELCEQETIIVNGRVTGGSRDKRRQPTFAQLREENRSLHRKIASQEAYIRSLTGKGNPEDNATARARTESFHSSSSASEQDEDDVKPIPTRGIDRVDFLTRVSQVWGIPEHPSHGVQKFVRFGQPTAHTFESLRSLVPFEHSSRLVRFHCNYLHWIHPVFHIPTFLEEHDMFLADLTVGRLASQPFDFFALYFAVISCSLYFIDEEIASSMGISSEAILVLPRFWFETSIQCLQLSGYLTVPTLACLQTICILPLVGHAFDASAFVGSLLHSALGLARGLNFHLATADSDPATFGGNVQVELIRRIWWHLMTTDSLNPAANHPFHLVYPAAWSCPPANVNDIELVDGRPVHSHPLHLPTGVSHTLIMSRIADIFRDFNQTFHLKKSSASRYRFVQDLDSRLQTVLGDMPDLRLHSDWTWQPIHCDPNVPLDYRLWCRFLIATLPNRILLYRWFFAQSYSIDQYIEARHICLLEARRLLATRHWPVPPMFLKHWHVASTVVLCGMVLGVELLQARMEPPSRHALQQELVQVVLYLRGITSPNALITRGIGILEKILGEASVTASAVVATVPPIPAVSTATTVSTASSGSTVPPNPSGWGNVDPNAMGSEMLDVMYNYKTDWTGTSHLMG